MRADWRQRVEACQRAIAPLLASDTPERAESLMLSLLCLRLCAARGLVSAGVLQSLSDAAELHHLLQALRVRALPIPTAWLSVADVPAVAVTTARGWICADPAEPLPVTALGQAYEQCLAGPARKAGGAYYTPEAIAAFMVEQTVGALPSESRVLDPACGGGVFLLAAYEHILSGDRAQGAPASYERRQQILQQLYGVDIDSGAIAIAQISLLLKLIEAVPDLPPQLPDLSANLRCGNAILGTAFCWQQAFPTVMQAGGFDAVIGNPPYLDAEQMVLHQPDWRRYCTQHYRTAAGNWDLFCVFIEKAIDLCRLGGLTSLLVPNKLVSAAYAAPARSLLAQANQLLSLRDYSQTTTFGAAVYPLVYVARKCTPRRSAQVRYESVVQHGQQWAVTATHLLGYEHFHTASGWLLETAPAQRNLITRLQKLPRLGELAQVTGAATVAEAYVLSPLLQDGAPLQSGLRMVNSGTIDRYRLLWGEKPMRYLGVTYRRPVLPHAALHQLPPARRQQAQQPKLIVSGMAKRLKGAIDPTGNVLAGKSTTVVRSAIDLRYLLGLLNSSLLSFYFSHCFSGNRLRGGYLRVGPPQLRQLPVWVDEQGYDRLIELVEQRLTSADPMACDRQIDRLVADLYELTDAEQSATCYSTNILF